MAKQLARQFPITANNPDAIPTGPDRLRPLRRKQPVDLTKRELLAGVYTLLENRDGRAIDRIRLLDTFTAIVTFAEGEQLQVALLTDSNRVTSDDVRPLLAMRRDDVSLLVVAATSWIRYDARRLCADHASVGLVSIAPEPFSRTPLL